MADNTINVRIKDRSDTEANWTSKNPVLLKGERAITDGTGKYKIGDGKNTWGALPYYEAMTSADRTKLNGIASGANKTTVDSSLSSSSTNPVQNKVVNSALAGKSNINHTHDLSTMINTLSTGGSTPTDDDYFVSQYVGGGTTTTSYHRRPVKALLEYIKGKLAKVATSGSYNDLSNKPTIPSVGNGTITIKQAGAVKGSFTTNQSGATTIELTDNNTNTWGEITGKPSTYTPSSHNHNIEGLTNFSAHVYDATVSRTANTVLAAPNGSNGSASFRKLVASDLPSHTHNYAGSSSAGGAAWSSNAVNNIFGDSRQTSGNIDFTNSAYVNKVTYTLATSKMTTGKPPTDGHILNFGWDTSAGYGAQMSLGNSSGNHLYIRGAASKDNKTTYEDWKTILDSSNYNIYAPTKAGGGASGTWGINITGNAATATKLGTSAGSATQPVYFSGGKPVAGTYTLGNACSKTTRTLKTAGDSGWKDASTDSNYVPDMSFIAYWNGAYSSSGGSNLAYCNKGAFGTAATKNTDYFATAGHTHTAINNGITICGRTQNSGDDEGLVINKCSNNYAGLILGSPNGIRSVFYLTSDNNALWRYNNGSSSFDIKHPKKAGTVALTSDIPSKLPASDVYAWAKASTKPSYSWGEISGKPSTYTPSSHNHDDRYYTESEINSKLNGKANSSHTHNYAGSSSVGGSANSAVKLATARTVSNTEDFVMSFSYDGSANSNASLRYYNSSISVGNTNNYPYHRFAKIDTQTGSYIDKTSTFLITQDYNGGGWGIVRISLRINSSSSVSTAEAKWLVRCDLKEDCVQIGLYNVFGKTYADAFFKTSGTFAGTVIRNLASGARGGISRTWTLTDSAEANSTTTSDKKTSTESYVSTSAAATTLHSQAYTSVVVASDGGTVSYANSAGNASKVNNYTVNSNVPSGAKFTDTVYSHPTTSGNKHIPSGGSSGQILRWSSDGTAVWGNDNNTTYTLSSITGTLAVSKGGTGSTTAAGGRSNLGAVGFVCQSTEPSGQNNGDIWFKEE